MRLDPVSVGFLAFAVFAGVYLYVVVNVSEAIVPVVIAVAGASLMALVLKPPVEEDIAEPFARVAAAYSLLALAAFIFIGFAVRQLVPSAFLDVVARLNVYQAVLFTSLMAVSEEFFFRGFLTAWLESRSNVPLAILGSAAVFTAYHFAVYGTSASKLLYVFAGGVVLAYVFLKARSLAPTITAHVLNNILVAAVR